ncbi:C25 family cysteine peptidase [Cecembia calidifontis]|uniref:Peptidase C25-like protein n=1 Tax=Cecembia calidifontis TaxID=1187080 RepID=A0A4Q7P834_9BACT|nr:peptidase C25-like protein [Cecembia calidifontis]
MIVNLGSTKDGKIDMNGRNLIILISLIWFGSVQAQSTWVDYNLTYYKIPTVEDGIHRISFAALASAGINPNTLDPRTLRMYHRGEEVAIFVQGEEDGRFDVNDFIDFYGKRNDATLDRKLFRNPSWIGNIMYNHHNDTTAFFLTITPGTSGKRMASRSLPQAVSPILESYQTERMTVYSDQYNLGRVYFPGVRLAEYEEGQGWMSAPVTKASPRNISFTGLGQIPTTGNAKLEIGLVGRSENPHVTAVAVGPTLGSVREVARYTYSDFNVLNQEIELNAADFSTDGNVTIRVSSNGPESVDNISIAYVRITFPKRPQNGDLDRETIILGPGDAVYQGDNMLSNYVAYDILDPNNPIRVPVEKIGNRLRFSAGNPNTPVKIWLENRLSVKEVGNMERVRFRNLLNQPADYIIVSHRNLRRQSSVHPDPVRAYAQYRASREGGSFDTLTVNINELYDQFSFGEKTPLAIFEFLRAYYPRHKPEYLFLIGRSMGMLSTVRQGNITHFYRRRPDLFTFQDLIPPAGYPYADNNFAIGLDPANPLVPAMAIGRIPARNPQDVTNYLEKAREKDALGATEDWQKEIVHLSGGISAFELTRFFNFLNGFKTIAEGPFLGGNVKTYRKRSNSTVELIDISSDVNNGVSMVTFFGHAAPTVIDIEIGLASDPTMGYNNRGKYPMILMNGCDAGNSYGNVFTFGEDWIVTPSKGASNFLAHANIGIDVYLRRYSESLYTKAFADSSMIYRSVGQVRQEAEKLFYLRYGTSVVNRSHAEQLVLLGDPALRIFPADKADYAIREEDVELSGVDGEDLNANAERLKLSFILRNLGRVDLDSVEVKVSRRLPDGTIVDYPIDLIAPVFRRDTIDFILPNTGVNAFGDNNFTIIINPGRNIPEMTFINNSVSVNKFIPLSGTLNVLPYNFAIVNERNVTLTAQVQGKLLEPRNLVFQLDTDPNFSSARRREVRLTTANIASWDLDIFQNVPLGDSVTFYWRTRFLEPRQGESEDWTVSSFSYIQNGPEGWTQRVLPQMTSNLLNNLEIDFNRREWKFRDTQVDVEVFTFGNRTDSLTSRNVQFILDGVPQIIDSFVDGSARICPDGSLGLVALDQRSLTPYLAIPIPGFDILDGRSCGKVPQIIQNIRNAWVERPGFGIEDYVNGVKDGDYVVIFSIGAVNFEQWSDVPIQKLKELGANEAVLRNLKNGDPYILFGRKGMRPGESIEVVADVNLDPETNEQVITFETTLNGYFTSASILTPRIGPASEWKEFFNEVKSRNWINQELTHFDVYGVTPTGDEQVIFASIQEEQLDLSNINPNTFPFLRLRYAMEDEEATAAAQLAKWQVNYTGVPEGVLVFKGKEEQVRLQEGEEHVLNFEFVNISKFDFLDSLVVEWTITNNAQRKSTKFSKKIPAIKAGESHDFNILFNSIGWGGTNIVEVFANPRIIMEQTFRNNLIDLDNYYVVNPDNTTSILDVHFDGVYIMDGDIVSPTVMITSLLRNEKSLILKKDTLGIELFIRKQCDGCQFERINFSSPKINWSEATENSSFKVELRPGPLDDGMYTFRVVTEDLGMDKPYEINFEVINEASITNFYPYPNPFSTSVRFVFTVTGSEIPDQIKIQIMTVTGRVVREILQDELGPLRIGNNITEYAWDGRDEFGDQLANGVYIYRVLVRKNGTFVEPRATAGDKAFKQGYGKMYLLR